MTQETKKLCMNLQDFNSHAHVERDRKLKKKENGIADFNSHAHVERDVESAETIILQCISTHTLTWSVTRFTALALYYTNFNSHAHVERDTIGSASDAEFLHFNSHAHVERDKNTK